MLVFICPHCNDSVIILESEINCAIFRHGVYKSDYKQIDPHLCKEECDRLYNTNSIYGCGKPFRLIQKNNLWDIEICEYL